MRLRVADLLEDRGMTAYELSKRSDGKITMTTAYRLASGKWARMSPDVMDAVCDVLHVDPGALFERTPKRKR